MLNKNCAVEGCIWIMPKLDEKWQDTDSRNILLDIIHTTEHEETLKSTFLGERKKIISIKSGQVINLSFYYLSAFLVIDNFNDDPCS